MLKFPRANAFLDSVRCKLGSIVTNDLVRASVSCEATLQLAKFLPKLADSMEPIRRLIRKNFQWSWTKEQETAFQEIKKLVTEARVLSYYNPSSDLAILCNASQKGLSAALLQDQKPVARALTETETRYAQIEKEMLAIVTLPPLHRAHLRSSTSLPMEDTSPFTAITNPLKQS